VSDLVLPDESYQIIGACFEVYNEMGCGFLEAVYHECLEIEFAARNIPYVSKPPLKLRYKDKLLLTYYQADFVCFSQIVLEIKTASSLVDENSAQVLNYLNATRLPLGILVNFGHYPKLESKRIALTGHRSESF
jgi:GxxExxY protein